MKYDPDNEMFRFALDLVNQSSQHIFLTGKAGTGKTTFLKYIRENCPKQMAVVAPTGVAAINAGGVTIHSFFQLPFAPFVPEAKKFSHHTDETVDRQNLVSRLRIGSEKIRVLQQLELLIVDEVSMVRCDTMDAIDTVLRHIRKKPAERFGGVQVLLIGDMFQLPPVIKEAEWQLLRDHYDSPYFFDSEVIRAQLPVYIEFNKIYRQTEVGFIRLLNQVRNNELDGEGREILEKRFQPAFERHKEDGYIVLTTHNERARDINTYELKNLTGRQFSYKAVINGDFPGNAYPADEHLYLKTGAQVMFIKNDSDKTKRYFNGKIGVVTELYEDKIVVRCKDEPDDIEVVPDTWENIRYTVNKTSRAMEEEVLGSFSQYPLRLAWGITIHKSQGLTFEKAIIDAGEAFAAGQVYVALSRCTSLEGMVLKSRIKPGSLFTDKRIVQFSANAISGGRLEKELAIARKDYQEKLILETFDFSIAINNVQELSDYLRQHSSSFNAETAGWIREIDEKFGQVQATAIKFYHWLRARFGQSLLPEEDVLLQTKIRDGAVHFVKELQGMLALLQQSPAVTDSRIHAKEFNERAKEIFAVLSLKIFLLKDFNGTFSVEEWHKRKKNFVLPAVGINAYAGSASASQQIQSPHPQLYHQLRRLRDAICSKKDLPIYLVAGSKSLDEMARYLPQTEQELQEISGFGKVRAETYGKQFLEIIQDYCEENRLSSRVSDKPVKAGKKEGGGGKTRPGTKAESLRLFREGMPVAAIATARKITVQTVEGHLAYYVGTGEIGIGELVQPEKVALIAAALKEVKTVSLSVVKDRLDASITYNEIKLVIAWQAFKSTIEPGS